jgi:hypothetical protein
MKKIMNADAQVDKKVLEKQLKEEDMVILDDLLEVAKDAKIGYEKMDTEIIDRLLAFEDEGNIPDSTKY